MQAELYDVARVPAAPMSLQCKATTNHPHRVPTITAAAIITTTQQQQHVQEPVELTEASATNLPVSGVLEFDYVSTAKAPPDSVPATDAQARTNATTYIDPDVFGR